MLIKIKEENCEKMKSVKFIHDVENNKYTLIYIVDHLLNNFGFFIKHYKSFDNKII